MDCSCNHRVSPASLTTFRACSPLAVYTLDINDTRELLPAGRRLNSVECSFTGSLGPVQVNVCASIDGDGPFFDDASCLAVSPVRVNRARIQLSTLTLFDDPRLSSCSSVQVDIAILHVQTHGDSPSHSSPGSTIVVQCNLSPRNVLGSSSLKNIFLNADTGTKYHRYRCVRHVSGCARACPISNTRVAPCSCRRIAGPSPAEVPRGSRHAHV